MFLETVGSQLKENHYKIPFKDRTVYKFCITLHIYVRPECENRF
jgi:hypothetical protein